MKRLIIATGAALAISLLAAPVFAQQNRPNATFLFGGDIFSSGQSDNIGPVANKMLEDYWDGDYTAGGDCPLNGSYAECDALRYGLTMYPHADDGGACTVASNELVRPQEDGGGLVEDELQNIQNDAGDTYCDDPANRPMSKGMYALQSSSFDGTENDADSPWDRANLNLTVVGEFPQEPDGSGGYQTTIKESIQAACDLLNGDNGSGAGSVPPIPTWVMVARRFDDEVVPFAGLASAAGGTGACCYDSEGSANEPAECDPTEDEDQIDVCAHISGRSESVLKSNIQNSKYNCAAGAGYVQVGQMAYPNLNSANGVQKAISCHLVGRQSNGNGDQCTDPLEKTDVLGKMSCVRQLPRDFNKGEDTLAYCDDAGNCTELTDCSDAKDPNDPNDDCTPNIEWVDPQKTMYVIVGEDQDGNKICDEINAGDGDVIVDPCPNKDDPCTTGKQGRCRPGTIQCVGTVEFCQQSFDPMPEICNGLDDDCDGRKDNLSDSWDDFSYDPTTLGDYNSDGINREGIHCFERNVCRDVPDDDRGFNHAGTNFEEYVTNWVPDIYVCSEGMSTEASAAGSSNPQPTAEPTYEGAACSATGDDQPVPLALLVIPAMALGALLRRRR
ncbi:MAG: MYXO-CTERM sorting domain-containing protein [Myxococcota bacterium]